MNETQFNECIQNLFTSDQILRNRFDMNIMQKQQNPYNHNMKWYLVLKHWKQLHFYNLIMCYNDVFNCPQIFFEVQDIDSGQFISLDKIYDKEDLKRVFIMDRNPLNDSMMFTFHSCMMNDSIINNEPESMIYQIISLYLSKLGIYI